MGITKCHMYECVPLYILYSHSKITNHDTKNNYPSKVSGLGHMWFIEYIIIQTI